MTPDLYNALTSFLYMVAQVLLIISLPILIAAAAFWLRQKANEIKARLSAEQLATLQNVAGIAVKAAEQAGLSKQLASGSEKREYALKVAQDYLNTIGVKVDVKAVTSLIESEVLKQFNSPTPIVDSPEARAALLQKAVESGVLAAEQSGLKAAAMNVGVSLAQQKKQYATNLAQKYLEQHGIRMDPQIVDGLIEAQIMRFKMAAAAETAKLQQPPQG